MHARSQRHEAPERTHRGAANTQLQHALACDACSRAMQVMDEQLPQARRELETALRLLPAGRSRHRSAILSFLVPVCMLQGRMPRREMLQAHGLSYYIPLVDAVAAGDPGAVADTLEKEERRFMRVRPPAR
jgi:hypothetical protein